MKFKARVWCVDDDINTDLILPIHVMTLPRDQRPQHMFMANRPGWSEQVRPGDILVSGKNYGMGSSRPAAQVMKDLGLSCLLSESVNGLFFRNAVNYAFPMLEIEGVRGAFKEGDVAEVDFEAGTATNLCTKITLRGPVWPEMALKLLRAGGVVAQLDADGYLHPPGWRPAPATSSHGLPNRQA